MIKLISELSKILNEAYSGNSLESSLADFFENNFGAKDFSISIEEPYVDNNKFKYPLLKHKKCIGYLLFDSETNNLREFLDITAQFISLKIQNVFLNDKMQKNINFHETMKNIAKIIETQYELNFIIPLIGEMLDKFFVNYLIYIYLTDESTQKTSLAWPATCKDNFIEDRVKNNPETRFLSENGKTYFIPLNSESKRVGVMVAKSTSDEISHKDLEYLDHLGGQISTTINRAAVYGEILKHATLDALTGFYNRHQLEQRIKQEVSNAHRQNAPLCGIMTDIDFFKSVNDNYGHAVGDLVLKTIAKIIRGQLREYDIAGRYGGEEFSILLPFTKIQEAQMVAERLRQSIEEHSIDISKVNPDADVKTINITLSLGIYEMKKDDNEDDLMRKADKALYQAKNTGRNKVVINYD